MPRRLTALSLTLILCLAAQPGWTHGVQRIVEVEMTAIVPAPADELCRWDAMTSIERVKIWTEMSPKHRDYHWRLMSEQEKIDLKNLLPPAEQRKIRERFISRMSVQQMDRPYILYKRLTKDELVVLRQQIRRARESMDCTPGVAPAPSELDNALGIANGQHHRRYTICRPMAESAVRN